MKKFKAQSIDVEEVDNTHQVFIRVSQDRLKLKLHEYRDYFSNLSNWTLPLGIFLSLSLSILSSDYKEAFGLEKSDVKAIVVVSLIISGSWLIYAIIKSIVNYKAKSIDDLIEKIKSEQ